MDSIFCRSCGTLIAETEDCCPFCGREMDWKTRQQKDTYVKQKNDNGFLLEQSRTIAAESNPFPNTLFGTPKIQQSEESFPKSEESPQQAVNRLKATQEILLETAVQIPSKIKPLSMGETVLLAVCALIPVVGTLALIAAAFWGDKEASQNRQTLAKGLLLVQLVVLLVLFVLVFVIVNSLMMLMPYLLFPQW